MAYNYGYTSNSYGWPVQTNDMQAYQSGLTRPCQATPQHRRNQHPQYQRQHQRQQEQQSQSGPLFVPYEPTSLYSFSQQGSGQSAVHAFQQHMAIRSNGALLQPTSALPDRGNSTTQSIPARIAIHSALNRLNLPALSEPTLAQVQVRELQAEVDPPSYFDEEYAQYRISLCIAFDQIHKGRLVDAGRELLEISKWLVTKKEYNGILRSDLSESLVLWTDFNHCWLALFQKQMDMTQIVTTDLPTGILKLDQMEAMGNDLIQLCDELEPYGLVDYQKGIWEEQIINTLLQCVDLMGCARMSLI